MNNDEAKKQLGLFRPGSEDRNDPEFKEALNMAKPHPPLERWQEPPDSSLAGWFREHCASYLSVKSKFDQIPTPAGLKERILAEAQPPAPKKIIPFRPAWILRAAAVITVGLGLTMLIWHPSGRDNDFDTYRSRMARTAQQPYGMDKLSPDLNAIHDYLAQRHAPADYTLPPGIATAKAVGCAVVTWQGREVSMLCFHSGKPLADGAKTDLWLFVIDKSTLADAPDTAEPLVKSSVNLMTATWSQGGKIYLLAAAGDESFLRKYL